MGGRLISTRVKRNWIPLLLLLAWICQTGCGSTKSRTATEQLLMSDAVDRAVAQIDFKELSGQKVFFDTKFVVNTKDPAFIGNLKGLGYVNAEYVISSLRQQMVAADCRLQDKLEDADFVVEARLGAVGVDNNEVVYGLPASAPYSAAANVVSNGPSIPSLPELSVARKIVQVGAAKIGVFAYERQTREPVWQAGISQAVSNARDSWILGIGPFQEGTIYRGTQFAGSRMQIPTMRPLPPMFSEEEPSEGDTVSAADEEDPDDPLNQYAKEHVFRHLDPHKDEHVKPTSGEKPDVVSGTGTTANSGAASAGSAGSPPSSTSNEPGPLKTGPAQPVKPEEVKPAARPNQPSG
ncbi:MAG: DUF6655 family protein [Planctomycetota bacterium]